MGPLGIHFKEFESKARLRESPEVKALKAELAELRKVLVEKKVISQAEANRSENAGKRP